jgi:hypothetical protein
MLRTGTFAETNSPKHQLHFILDNCKLVKNAGGLTAIIDAFVKASATLDRLVCVHSPLNTHLYCVREVALILLSTLDAFQNRPYPIRLTRLHFESTERRQQA